MKLDSLRLNPVLPIVLAVV